jgi:hypothetical protein
MTDLRLRQEFSWHDFGTNQSQIVSSIVEFLRDQHIYVSQENLANIRNYLVTFKCRRWGHI